jgi:hypothetical protein
LEIEIPARHGSLPPFGFFAGAKDVDASHSIFTDVARDVNIDRFNIAGDMKITVENQVCCEAFVLLNNH